jgi:predicted MFS family arabinose efflux permease
LAALAVIPVVAIFLRNSPADMGLLPYGADADYQTPAPLTHPISAAIGALNDARQDGIFWLLWGSFFVCGLSTNGLIQTHFLSAAHDHQVAAATAAGYLALIGGFDVIGTVASGWFTDRYDPAKLLIFYYALRGVSLMVLDPTLTKGGFGLAGFMMFYGLDWVATVPPTVSLCVQRFGVQRGPLVYGWVFAGHQVGAAVAAWGAGYLRDSTGTYKSSFFIAGVCCLLAAYGSSRLTRDKVTTP